MPCRLTRDVVDGLLGRTTCNLFTNVALTTLRLCRRFRFQFTGLLLVLDRAPASQHPILEVTSPFDIIVRDFNNRIRGPLRSTLCTVVRDATSKRNLCAMYHGWGAIF
uniref:Protein kinase rad3 n=1 Tax=Lygus hesperus TaxID=30085 RepID=A0A0A9WYF4_LYGHE